MRMVDFFPPLAQTRRTKASTRAMAALGVNGTQALSTRTAVLLAAVGGLSSCVPRLNDDQPLGAAERRTGPYIAETAPSDQAPNQQPLGATSGTPTKSKGAPRPYMGKAYGSSAADWLVPDAGANVDQWLLDRKVRQWGHERCWTFYAGLGWKNECDCRPIDLETQPRESLLACKWSRTSDNLLGQSECFVVERTIIYSVVHNALRRVLDAPTGTWAMDEGCDRYGPRALMLSKRVEGTSVVFGDADACKDALADFDATDSGKPRAQDVMQRRLARRAFARVCETIGHWHWRAGAFVHVR